jgi:hypothetical protein
MEKAKEKKCIDEASMKSATHRSMDGKDTVVINEGTLTEICCLFVGEWWMVDAVNGGSNQFGKISW